MLHDEETVADGSGSNISCGPTVCQVLYAHLIYKCSERNGTDIFLVPFYREENLKSETLDNLSKATQLVRDIDGK